MDFFFAHDTVMLNFLKYVRFARQTQFAFKTRYFSDLALKNDYQSFFLARLPTELRRNIRRFA